MLQEYQSYLEKYDEETAADLMNTLYDNFRTFALLDTGAFSIEVLREKSKETAKLCGLEQKIVPVELSYLRQLLAGPWNGEKFYVIPPYGTIDL